MSKMKKIHENYTGTIARMDDQGNLEFDFCDDFGAHAILGEYDPAEARALADAIYKDLGLGWKKYIPGESEPEKSGWYYTTIENENGMGLAYGLWTPETGFTDSGGWEIQDVVHAFRLPFELYQPEDSHDQ